ncbi:MULTISPECIES: hypothetical protein [unclassified Tolypothrix]|uniref:hypothetical protein n=1 Tax=unclassified Tolypothrix TaxID=2649714 RepID=UPI0005EAAE06|nr:MULTISPECIES: hypothetical protein [unclassified Tolypothrix]BAY92736.1 hypothetical protein NIES3275_47730 [Microchaete diplosiphon NIES-3275]EKF05845.1 hypothetical protein FDUTEX481_00705 [Tolypothrix sp. PCC 7601]MBE9081491.1 hypothetical protein [Tolypothrix sp. LEGE 11397]UYD26660.1 hypothetical protein HGR01_00605 [Tolypothrix sp. PCC 7712]UYD37481.1 hypothetical protein HG267_18205 [Tolypothrix sp. PCC 7601]
MKSLKTNQNKSKDNSQRRSLLEWLGNASVLIFLLLLALLVRGGSFFNSKTTFTNTSEVAQVTDTFLGKSVTIRSKAIQKIGLSSFTVKDARFFNGEPILVVNASGVPFDLPVDQNIEVQVTCQVRNLAIDNIEQEFNLNLKDEYYKEYVNKPAIIAQYLALSPEPAQIIQSPEKYYGRKVAVTGKVANIRSAILLTLDENQLFGGQDLLVLLTAPPQVAINQGQTVSAMGEVRRFVAAEIERDYNFTWSLDTKRKLDAEYANQPVLVAETVYPS